MITLVCRFACWTINHVCWIFIVGLAYFMPLKCYLLRFGIGNKTCILKVIDQLCLRKLILFIYDLLYESALSNMDIYELRIKQIKILMLSIIKYRKFDWNLLFKQICIYYVC